jgi:hypothetical protein
MLASCRTHLNSYALANMKGKTKDTCEGQSKIHVIYYNPI